MKKKNDTENKRLFVIAVLSFLIMAESFILMPLDIPEIPVWRFIPGAVFWIFSIVGIVISIVLMKRYNKRAKKRMALITFFSNPYAVVADVVLIIGVVATIVLSVFFSEFSVANFCSIGLSAFAFSMHCLLNSGMFTELFKKPNSYSKSL